MLFLFFSFFPFLPDAARERERERAGGAVGGRDRDRAGDQEERELLLESAQRALATLAPSSSRGKEEAADAWGVK